MDRLRYGACLIGDEEESKEDTLTYSVYDSMIYPRSLLVYE